MAQTKQSDTGTETAQPRFSARFQIDSALVSKAAVLLGSRAKNAMFAVSIALITAVVFWLTLQGANVMIAVGLTIVAAVLWGLSSHWYDRVEKQLCSHGVVTGTGSGKTKVDVTDDAVIVTNGTDDPVSNPLDHLKRVCHTDTICAMEFDGPAYVVIPSTALSTARFNELIEFLGLFAKKQK